MLATVSVSDIADGIVAAAAIVTSGAALFGLNAWRKELRGKHEYNAARKLLNTVYALRDALADARFWMMNSGEAEEIKEDEPWQEAVYRKRLAPVTAAARKFRSAAAECEAVIGGDVNALRGEVLGTVNRLSIAAQNYLEHMRGEEGALFDKEDRSVLNSGGVDNFYDKELEAMVVSVEEYAKPHLKI